MGPFPFGGKCALYVLDSNKTASVEQRYSQVKLLVQPGDGIAPLIQGIKRARSKIEIAIFRFDQRELEKALGAAVGRGVKAQALIAHKNRGGELNLRALELRLLEAGVTVARTADDLVRYHDKFMIIDRRELYLLAFNFTHIDIERSRSFGVITTNKRMVREAGKLFEADVRRNPYTAGLANFIVSPVNARRQLGAFIKGAKKQLLIYDPEIGDPEMIRLLEDRAKAGVEIKILGRVSRRSPSIAARKLPARRLHTRTIVRDRREAFLGSQSLRPLELDARREVGMIFRDAKAVNLLIKTFEGDWDLKDQPTNVEVQHEPTPVSDVAKRVAKSVSKALPPVGPAVELAVNEMAGMDSGAGLNHEEIEEAVKGAVKEAVRIAVLDIVADSVLPE
jgi:cardiolipin synthase